MKKLIIHIGYPKTATTSLQVNIFTSLMNKGEIEYLNHLEKGNPNYGGLSVKKMITYALGQDLNADWPAEAKQFIKINKKISLLSDELISTVSARSPTASYKVGATENAK